MDDKPDDLLTPTEVAARLRVSIWTLAFWRRQGRGPASFCLSPRKIRYRRDDLEAFLAAASKGTPHATVRHDAP